MYLHFFLVAEDFITENKFQLKENKPIRLLFFSLMPKLNISAHVKT